MLNRLIPLDGEPVIDIDRFLEAYADTLPAELGDMGKRMKTAHAELTRLAKKREVEIDNGRRTITVLKSDAQLTVYEILNSLVVGTDVAEVEL